MNERKNKLLLFLFHMTLCVCVRHEMAAGFGSDERRYDCFFDDELIWPDISDDSSALFEEIDKEVHLEFGQIKVQDYTGDANGILPPSQTSECTQPDIKKVEKKRKLSESISNEDQEGGPQGSEQGRDKRIKVVPPEPAHGNKNYSVKLGNGRYRCSFPGCGKVFQQSSNFLSHQNIHNNIKPYVCKNCGRAFTERTNYQTHMLSHKGEMPFACSSPNCLKRFATKANLLRHVKAKHLGIKDHFCPMCPDGFGQKSHLQTHLQKIHGQRL